MICRDTPQARPRAEKIMRLKQNHKMSTTYHAWIGQTHMGRSCPHKEAASEAGSQWAQCRQP